jgi:uncharacterized membrane protein YfcA
LELSRIRSFTIVASSQPAPIKARISGAGKPGRQEQSLITDPWFYLAAVPAVLLFGIAKGGFGGGLGVIAVPLMALVVSPLQAAAVLLPILCLMDLVGLWAYRGKWLWPELRILLPAALIGIVIGTLLFGHMSAAMVRLIVGVIAIVFTLHHFVSSRQRPGVELPHFSRSVGLLAGATGGFTSFIAHAGGPPISMYLLRRPLDRTEFVGTTVLLFAAINYAKLAPYAWLGQLSAENLLTSLILSPLAPIGVYTGVWLHRRVSEGFFFRLMYLLLFVVGGKLLYEGLTAI